ncbi:hypothetical protein F4561_002893 [Lipingzhangella halophila]|uniref:MYXO-CTERM domain-containing protein n=1 Tax=Lipingzhangella halophila TaxID=1783352 RepID=A0A7W7RHI0_9ACTN|nr:hypothetical protein [Lipingzhangella halophila]MBB4932073.1 hypothetical protein [Lipingzhangella halophila]
MTESCPADEPWGGGERDVTVKTRWAWRGRRHDQGGPPAGSGDLARGQWEPAAYWLLYVVAFLAVLLHWRAGNVELAVLCAVAVLVSVWSIMRAHRGDAV